MMKKFARNLAIALVLVFSPKLSNAAWTVQEKKDDFTDKLIAIYTVNIDTTRKAMLSFGCYRLPASSSLLLPNAMPSDFKSLDVKLRVGSGVPVERTWELIGGRDLKIDDESWRSMLEANGGTVIVGFKLFDDIYKFDINGINQSISQVDKKCASRPW